MEQCPPADVTRLLAEWRAGNEAALERLVPVVYAELRRLAQRYLGRERAEHTLEPTALVHEVYLKLLGQHDVQWQNRAHFFGVSAQLMRRILVDHARARRAAKRGDGQPMVTLDEAVLASAVDDATVVALDDALRRLADIDPAQSRLVELRFFGGLTVEETAEVMEISPRTVKREWAVARAWLYREVASR